MIGMQARLSYTAIVSAIAVMTAMWILKDTVLPKLATPKVWMHHRWLRFRGMEEYVGRHRI